jgi:hypothetical protein
MVAGAPGLPVALKVRVKEVPSTSAPTTLEPAADPRVRVELAIPEALVEEELDERVPVPELRVQLMRAEGMGLFKASLTSTLKGVRTERTASDCPWP